MASTNTTFMDYRSPRRFVHNSRLRSYLAFKKPASQFMVRDVSTLNEVSSVKW